MTRYSVRIDKLEFACLVAGVLRDGRTPRRVLDLLSSRPRTQGVYDGRLGGLKPRPWLCRACMR